MGQEDGLDPRDSRQGPAGRVSKLSQPQSECKEEACLGGSLQPTLALITVILYAYSLVLQPTKQPHTHYLF